MKNTLLLGLLVLPAALGTQAPAFCAEMLQKANAALRSRDWNRARDYCEAALPLCPNLNKPLSEALRAANRGVESEKEKAREAQASAQAALKQVVQEKTATEAQRKIAEQNFLLAQQKTTEAEAKAEEARLALQKGEETTVQIVQNLLRNASAHIYHLRYDEAMDVLHDAVRLVQGKPADSPLDRLRPVLADSLIKPAYFLAETGQYVAALLEVDILASLLDILSPANSLHDKVSALPTTTEEARQLRAAFRVALQKLLPDRCAVLEQRYYPSMLPVPGGTYEMSEKYTVSLSSFQLSRTEATFFQWAVYANVAGKKITNFSPSWGLDGDNPAVNVSWYDATAYANWLSDRAGLAPAYRIDSVGRIQNKGWIVALDSSAAGYRLPTEAEWQYAAANAGRDKTTYAGYGEYPQGEVENWRGPDSGSSRVLRGGSWYDDGLSCSVSWRYFINPTYRTLLYGFRLAQGK